MEEYPGVLGVYFRVEESSVGTGATRSSQRQTTYWYARQLGADSFEVQPLNVFHVPSGIKRYLTLEVFLEAFTPEPGYYRDNAVPPLRSLHETLRKGRERFLEATFSREETEFVEALIGDVRPGTVERDSDGRAALDRTFEHLSVAVNILMGNCESSRGYHCRKLNAFGVSLRKSRRFDQSINFLSRAIELNPGDDHAHFNIARSYFDKNDLHNCQDHLSKALTINPGFREARLFSAFCDRYEAETSGGRTA